MLLTAILFKGTFGAPILTLKREGGENAKLLYHKTILTLWRESHYFNHTKWF